MPNIDQVQLPDGSQYNLKDDISGYVTAGYVDDAIDALTKADVGLGNVDNTSDLNKPVSTAQQTALNGKTNTTVIAPTEATTTASRRYEIGEQFILNGVLYTATAVIASGDSIIVNTNCDLSESITGQIKEVDAKTQHGIAELWTNSAPTSAFAGQAIQISNYDTTKYDGIWIVLELDNNASDTKFTEIDNSRITQSGYVHFPKGMYMYPESSACVMIYREIRFSLSGSTLSITFSDNYRVTQSSIGSQAVGDQANTLMIPIRVYGIIHNS